MNPAQIQNTLDRREEATHAVAPRDEVQPRDALGNIAASEKLGGSDR